MLPDHDVYTSFHGSFSVQLASNCIKSDKCAKPVADWRD